MAKFVEFIDNAGEKVSVNVDLITKVRPSTAGIGTSILFGTDRGVTVEGDYQEVMDALLTA